MPFLIVALVLLLALSAFAAAGDLDTRFGAGGVVRLAAEESSLHARGLALQPDGKILVTAVGRRGWLVHRLTASGRRDGSFGVRGRVEIPFPSSGEPLALALLPDGRILIGGTSTSNGNANDAVVVRLLADGRLDPAWGTGGRGIVSAPARVFVGGMAATPDGGVVLATSVHDTNQRFVVWRLGPDGRMDTGFGQGGAYVDPEFGSAQDVGVQPSGRIVAAGERGRFGYVDPKQEMVVALTPDGRVDERWGDAGRFFGPRGSTITGLTMAPDGGVVALDTLPRTLGVLWLTTDGRRRGEWGLEGRAPAAPYPYAWPYSRPAISPSGEVYVPARGHYAAGADDDAQEIAGVAKITGDGVVSRSFGGPEGVAFVPATKQSVRSNPESIAVGQGDRIFLAASGSDQLQGFREDFSYSHALVARLKGWEELAVLAGGNPLRARRRRHRIHWYCQAPTGTRCRVRIELRDRRGRVLARGRKTATYGPTTVRSTRALRARERITVRLSATDAAGRADSSVKGYTVPRS